MLPETLKLKIGNLAHQYLMGLPPENIQGTYNVAMYGPDSLLTAVDEWIEKEGKRLGAIDSQVLSDREKRITAREKGDAGT